MELMKKNLVEESVFGLSFEGEYVNILTKMISHRSMQNVDTGDITEENTPLTVTGFVLDIDDEFIYLGEDPHQISKAVNRESVEYVEINNPTSPFDDILDQLGDKPEEKDIN